MSVSCPVLVCDVRVTESFARTAEGWWAGPPHRDLYGSHGS